VGRRARDGSARTLGGPHQGRGLTGQPHAARRPLRMRATPLVTKFEAPSPSCERSGQRMAPTMKASASLVVLDHFYMGLEAGGGG
jgi:hypothetical protein